jgi:peptidoglycan/LPS O-acetylase OafA/YrhL
VSPREGSGRGPLTALCALLLGRPGTRQRHFDALDGLRGLAVLIVIVSHMSLYGIEPLRGFPLRGAGKSGVYLFFVLSAFLLTRILLERTPAQFADRRLWAGYALRRVLRIWPLYLAVLLASWAITSAGIAPWPYRIDTGDLLGHLALREGESVLWSIPVEFKFYLCLPLLAFTLAWMAARRWPLAVQFALLAVALALATWLWPPAGIGRQDVRLGPYLVLFLCGGFAAALDRRIAAADRVARASGWWAGLGLLAIAAVMFSIPPIWAWATGTIEDPRLNHHRLLYFGFAWSALLLAVLHGPWWLQKPFTVVPMRVLGIVSFSAYLLHLPVVALFRGLGARHWPGGPFWTLAAIVVVAIASFLVIERPWRDVRLRTG